ncbi:CrcB-like protein-domain-containing protein [Podospora fimiseda]|uniref:CrcB-like protein-domain-containing protein n=1 Tax=Podospora fimiseda TaxID=252190 RepID=A0AAN7BLM6_9PEZI|nr:CrcB-like protein-domain-containing protein [Podospora fimiseda]
MTTTPSTLEARKPSTTNTYDIPSSYSNLDDLTTSIPPLPPTLPLNTPTLEQSRSHHEPQSPPPSVKPSISRPLTTLYTISHLIFFSLLGTLARLGLQSLTTYPNTPFIYPSLWPNFSGCLILGFLSEDRFIFRHYYHHHPQPSDHQKQKKTIPPYIGLSTGFCGSFTSFSSFIRDVFLALSDTSREGGYSFLAILGVVIITLTISISGFFFGAHISIFLGPYIPGLPHTSTKIIDNAVIFLGLTCWLGAIIMAVFPPEEKWRGIAVFALVFAPLGCLGRFFLSLKLNGRISSFPLGTFVVNILGTAVLGMAWDLAHVPVGGIVGCQVLQGIQDGFCGCLTTVSTWVAELTSLRRGHAYIYGGTSVFAGLVVLVGIMGGLKWSDGWEDLVCVH